jgi:hypothetical protein
MRNGHGTLCPHTCVGRTASFERLHKQRPKCGTSDDRDSGGSGFARGGSSIPTNGSGRCTGPAASRNERRHDHNTGGPRRCLSGFVMAAMLKQKHEERSLQQQVLYTSKALRSQRSRNSVLERILRKERSRAIEKRV